jgi:hypothetical protein
LILIISNIANEAAPALVASLPAGAASLIMASDLYRTFKAGISVGQFSSSLLTIHGKKILPNEISGIITTIPGFLPMEFYYIQPDDREYICAEANAFFNYFLSSVQCKKINPPGRRILSGLSLQLIDWVKIATGLNIPVQPFSMKNGKFIVRSGKKVPSIHTCTFIGGQIMDTTLGDHEQEHVRKLAKYFSLPYLTCYFAGENRKTFELIEINTIPDISNPKHSDAMLHYLQND